MHPTTPPAALTTLRCSHQTGPALSDEQAAKLL